MQNSEYIVTVKPADRRDQTRDTVLTFIMWGIYIYLWIPLITLLAWLFGFDRFYEVMITYGGFEVAVDLLDLYALMLISIVVSVVSWAGFNYYRFHRYDRRQTAPATHVQNLSEFFGVSEADIERARHAKILQIDLDDQGAIVKIAPDDSRPTPERY